MLVYSCAHCFRFFLAAKVLVLLSYGSNSVRGLRLRSPQPRFTRRSSRQVANELSRQSKQSEDLVTMPATHVNTSEMVLSHAVRRSASRYVAGLQQSLEPRALQSGANVLLAPEPEPEVRREPEPESESEGLCFKRSIDARVYCDAELGHGVEVLNTSTSDYVVYVADDASAWSPLQLETEKVTFTGDREDPEPNLPDQCLIEELSFWNMDDSQNKEIVLAAPCT